MNVNSDGQVGNNNVNNNNNGVRVDLKADVINIFCVSAWPVMLFKETASVPSFKGTESLSGFGRTSADGWKRRETFSSFIASCLAVQDRTLPGGTGKDVRNRGKMNYKEMSQFENLYQAHLKSRRGKRCQKEVIDFELDLGQQLYAIQWELISGRYRVRPYRKFCIHDPKERLIHALQYRDRIVQHTLCDNVIEPFMERHLIYDNAASRRGKGTHFAMGRLDGFLHKFYKEHGTDGYFLKYDIRKYFDSIDHEILSELFLHVFGEEERVYRLIRQFIDSYECTPSKGIPLGNQTSSWFALYYLDGLDRLIKEKLRIRYYTRYMDDGILVHQDKEYLKYCLEEMREFVQKERKLEFNQKTQITPLAQGIDYLGFHFYLTDTGKVIRRLRTSNKKRMKRKLKRFRHAYRTGVMDMEAVSRSLASYRGHLSHGNTYQLQKNLCNHLVLSKHTEKERKEYERETKEQIDAFKASAVAGSGGSFGGDGDAAGKSRQESEGGSIPV